MSIIYDKFWDAWYARARKRAEANPVWAQIEERRNIEGEEGSWLFNEEQQLSEVEWEIQNQIWEHLNPPTIFHHTHWFLETHGVQVQLRNVKSFLQRGKRGYAQRDLWHFSGYLATMLPEAICDLRDNVIGYPCSLESSEEWEDVLTQIADGFDAGKQLQEGPVDASDLTVYGDDASADELQARFDNGMELFKEYFFDLWD